MKEFIDFSIYSLQKSLFCFQAKTNEDKFYNFNQ